MSNSETFDNLTWAGSAYIFNVSTGAPLSTLVSPKAETDGYFGWTVAVCRKLVAVGALGETSDGISQGGRAYVFSVT
jgi:hypothetical protein